MADSSIIKEYALSLGWKIDQSSFNRYSDALKKSDMEVLALGASIAAVAVASFEFTNKMAQSMEKLYFATRRTGATSAELQGFSLGIANAGGNADAAARSIQNLANYIKYTPGGANILRGMGVDAKGLADAKVGIVELGNKWMEMSNTVQGRALALYQSQMYGVDFDTFQALVSGKFQDETKRVEASQRAFGVTDKDLEKANQFESKLRDMESTFVSFGRWLESDLNEPMSKFVGWVEKSLVGLQDFIRVAQSSGMSAALQTAGVGKGVADVLGSTPEELLDHTEANLTTNADGTQKGFWGTMFAPEAYAGRQIGKFGSRLYGETIPGTSGNGDKEANAKAMQIFQYIKSKGFSDTAAAGLTGIAWTESGGTFDPTKFNPAGGGRGANGIFQVRGSRIDDFTKIYGHDPLHGTEQEQIDFALHEITNGKEKGNATNFFNAANPYSAGHIGQDEIQRSQSEVAAAASGAHANHVYNMYISTKDNPHAIASAIKQSLPAPTAGNMSVWTGH